jgi:hypothetical protein
MKATGMSAADIKATGQSTRDPYERGRSPTAEVDAANQRTKARVDKTSFSVGFTKKCSVESGGSLVTHFTTPFFAPQLLSWKA